MLYILVYGGAIAIAGVILYPLFDLILCKFITNSEFIYSASQYITKLIAFGFIMGVVFVYCT